MTRDQLIEKRKRKKRMRLAAIAGGAAVCVFLVATVTSSVSSMPKRRRIQETSTPVVEDYDTDTAVRKALSSSAGGNVGWNVNDSGWYYLNDDNTIFTSGWKTIEGQRYYFKDSGYMATGWVNTGTVRDTYFDENGVVDPTQKQKLVALTYDDGPSELNTPRILDALEKYGQKATFFICGNQAELYPEIVKREYDLGMETGNHTYDHPWLNMLEIDEILDEIDHCDRVITDITGEPTRLLRPTGGGISANLIESVEKPMIQWDVDSLDWDHKDPEKTYQRIVDNVEDGSVILMHDLFSPAADSADRIISALLEMGYKCVTIPELAEAYGYDLEAGGQYYAFYPDGCDLNKTREEGMRDPKAAWD